jgi:hypothetical protein
LNTPTPEGYARIMLRGPTTLENASGMKDCKDRRGVPAVVNVRGIPYVILDSVPPAAGEESDEQTRAYRKKDER